MAATETTRRPAALEVIRSMNRAYVQDRQGKEYVTYAGLLDYAHTHCDLASIATELIAIPCETNAWTAIVHARATRADGGYFEGTGDANALNVTKLIAMHSIRMAETRAKARALRDLCNVGGTCLEELSGDEDGERDRQTRTITTVRSSAPAPAPAHAPPHPAPPGPASTQELADPHHLPNIGKGSDQAMTRDQAVALAALEKRLGLAGVECSDLTYAQAAAAIQQRSRALQAREGGR